MRKSPELHDRKLWSTKDLLAAGVSRSRIRAAVRAGLEAPGNTPDLVLIKPDVGFGQDHGTYVVSGYEDDHDLMPAIACLWTGGVLCRSYAARRHNLIEDHVPSVEILVPYDRSFRRPWVRTYRSRNPEAFSLGVQTWPNDLGIPMRITSPARTVLDLLTPRGQEEERLGIDALRAYLGRGGRTLDLITLARSMGTRLTQRLSLLVEGMNAGLGPRP